MYWLKSLVPAIILFFCTMMLIPDTASASAVQVGNSSESEITDRGRRGGGHHWRGRDWGGRHWNRDYYRSYYYGGYGYPYYYYGPSYYYSNPYYYYDGGSGLYFYYGF